LDGSFVVLVPPITSDAAGQLTNTVKFPKALATGTLVYFDFVSPGVGIWGQTTAACGQGMGPIRPTDFVQKQITCDVAVFDEPGGRPVGQNRLKNGQVWYVNPNPVTARDGESWTAVFVSSNNLGFIPTKCVAQ
jgi:hypothetical protein